MISLNTLRPLEKRLRHEYPELVGFGIGFRRRAGRIHRELVLKLTVVKKRSRRSKGLKLLPGELKLPIGRTRRPLTLHIRTDVEAARIWRPLQFQLSDGEEAATATCLARWRADGAVRFGVVTAGHGIWTAGKQLTVATRDGPQQGVVLVSSDLFNDHLDATLVQLPEATTEAALLPTTPLPTAQAPLSLDETITLLGDSTTDGKDIRIKQWAINTKLAADALALHLSYELTRTDGSIVKLSNVVEAKGDPGLFVPGASGATWATATSTTNGHPMAFTSHGSDTAGIGAHLLDAAQWLQRTGALEDLALAWVPGQWWRV